MSLLRELRENHYHPASSDRIHSLDGLRAVSIALAMAGYQHVPRRFRRYRLLRDLRLPDHEQCMELGDDGLKAATYRGG